MSFSLATTESWRDKATGERKDRTEWHNVVIFNENLGKIAEQYCKKGAKVYLEGQLQTREFTDKEGNQRKTTEVVLQRFRGELTLLDSRAGAATTPATAAPRAAASAGSRPMERGRLAAALAASAAVRAAAAAAGPRIRSTTTFRSNAAEIGARYRLEARRRHRGNGMRAVFLFTPRAGRSGSPQAAQCDEFIPRCFSAAASNLCGSFQQPV